MRPLIVVLALTGCSDSPCERYIHATLDGGDPASNRCVEVSVEASAAFDRIELALSVEGAFMAPDDHRLDPPATSFDTTAISFDPIDPVITVDASRAGNTLAHTTAALVSQHGDEADYYTVTVSLP